MTVVTSCIFEEPIQHNLDLDPPTEGFSDLPDELNRYTFCIDYDDNNERTLVSEVVRYLLRIHICGGEWVCNWGLLTANSPAGTMPNQDKAERMLRNYEEQQTQKRLDDGWTLCQAESNVASRRNLAVLKADPNHVAGFGPLGYGGLFGHNNLVLVLGGGAQGCVTAEQVVARSLAIRLDTGYWSLDSNLVGWMIATETSLAYALVHTTLEILLVVVVGALRLDTNDLIRQGIVERAIRYHPDEPMWRTIGRAKMPSIG